MNASRSGLTIGGSKLFPWGTVAAVGGFVLVLVLGIVTLVTVGRTQSEVDDLKKQNAATPTTQAQAAVRAQALAQAQARARTQTPPVRAGVAAAPSTQPQRVLVPRASPPVRAASTCAPTTSTLLPEKTAVRESIWSGDIAPEVSNCKAASETRAPRIGVNARIGSGVGATTTPTCNKELFNRTPDELDANDIDPRDAFPLPAEEAPKNGHEAIAQMYSYDNFRASLDRSAPQGYLAPTYERQGFSKLGERNMCLWKEQMKALRDQYPKNMDVHELMESMMVPVPEQFYDFLYAAAEERGIDGIQYGDEGMGARAAGSLYTHLDFEAKTGAAPRKGSNLEGAHLVREAMQFISLTSRDEAIKAMQEITEARTEARAMGLALPPPEMKQLVAVATWAVKNDPKVAPVVAALRKVLGVPLPPASYTS